MTIDLLSQLPYTGAISSFFIAFFVRLFLDFGLKGQIVGYRYLVGSLNREDSGRFRAYTVAIQSFENSSLEDDGIVRILGIGEVHVIERLLASLHCLLQVGKPFVTGRYYTSNLGELGLGFPELTL